MLKLARVPRVLQRTDKKHQAKAFAEPYGGMCAPKLAARNVAILGAFRPPPSIEPGGSPLALN
jgi:hypothetical protein